MVTPIIPKATVGEREPRWRTFRGRLAASRQLRGVALIGALVLALGVLATLATIQLRPGSPAVSVPARIAVAAPWTGTCRSDVAGCVPEEQLVPGAPSGMQDSPVVRSNPYWVYIEDVPVGDLPGALAALPSASTGACRSDIAGCVPEERLVPGVPTSPSYTYPAVYGDDEGVTPGGVVSPPLTGTRVQQELYAIEVRDNGPATPGGDSGPCPPLQPCDR